MQLRFGRRLWHLDESAASILGLLVIATVARMPLIRDSAVLFAFCVFLISVAFLKVPSRIANYGIRVAVFCFLITAVCVVQAWLPVRPGPDANAYYDAVTEYRLADIFRDVYESIIYFEPAKLNIVSARLSFPALIKILLGSAAGRSDTIIAVANIFIWLLATISWVNAVVDKWGWLNPGPRFGTLLFTFMLLSMSSIYWSSVYNKDIIVTSFAVLSAASLANKKIFHAVLWLALASLLRPYSIVVVLAFWQFLNGRRWSNCAVSLAIIAAGLWASSGSVALLGNLPVVFVYIFLSPNPVDPNNWLTYFNDGSWTFSPLLLTLEGAAIGCFFVAGILLAAKYPKFRTVAIPMALAILVCSSVLVVEGYYVVKQSGSSYGFWQLGDNVVRKKLTAWPLVMTWCALSVLWCREWLPTKKRFGASCHLPVGLDKFATQPIRRPNRFLKCV